jgi:hypothetical protein
MRSEIASDEERALGDHHDGWFSVRLDFKPRFCLTIYILKRNIRKEGSKSSANYVPPVIL